MLQAMNTGHEGSLTTIHANSPRDALSRLETLVLTAGVELPHRAIREQISSAFDLLVQITRLVDGSRRLSHITEVLRMESDVITLQDVFVAEAARRGLRRPRRRPGCSRPLKLHGAEAALPREDGGQRRRPASELLPAGLGRRTAGASRPRASAGSSDARALSGSGSSRSPSSSCLPPPLAATMEADASDYPVVRAIFVTDQPTVTRADPDRERRGGHRPRRHEPRPGQEHRARRRPLAVDGRPAARRRGRSRAGVRRGEAA